MTGVVAVDPGAVAAPFWAGAVGLGVLAFALLPVLTNRALGELRG